MRALCFYSLIDTLLSWGIRAEHCEQAMTADDVDMVPAVCQRRHLLSLPPTVVLATNCRLAMSVNRRQVVSTFLAYF